MMKCILKRARIQKKNMNINIKKKYILKLFIFNFLIKQPETKIIQQVSISMIIQFRFKKIKIYLLKKS